MRTAYDRVPFPDHVNWASADAVPIHWYSAPGKLLRLDGGSEPWLLVRGRTYAELTELCAEIPGEWT